MPRGMVARSLAFALVVAAALPVARPAGAQFLAPAIDRPGFDRRPTQPSLRLATLGGLSLAIADENNELNLWDYAGSSLGLLGDRDSTSLDVYLDTGSLADRHTVGTTKREFARHHRMNLGLQAVGRSAGKFAAGLDAGYLTNDTRMPAQAGIYLDQNATIPLAVPTLNGTMFGGKWGWGAHLTLGNEALSDDYRILNEQGGDVQLKGGDLAGTPNPFIPDRGGNRIGGFGLGLGWYGTGGVQAAINWDRISDRVRLSNNNARRVYETEERRASNEFSFATIVKKSWITLGGQVGKRKYDSKEEYRFSLSGGLNGPPLVSRGDRLFRSFDQKFARARVAIEPPAVSGLTVGADWAVRYDKDAVNPATSPGNFNEFQQTIASDTLGITPPVVSSLDELRHWNAGVGVGYRVTSRIQVGVEGHRYSTTWDGFALHTRQRITDLRGGLEFVVTPAWTGRVGGYHRTDDADVFTAQNETLTNAVTAGVGWARPRSRYNLDAGVEIGKRASNYPDPTDVNGSTLRLMLYNRWSF